MPLVSVVIPCHNGAPYIGAAIDSALAQSDVELEVVVADDGSSDESPAIVESYGSPVRMIRVSHGNTQASRNSAIAISGGDFIALLDQDDMWEPQKLRRQLAILESAPELGLCYTAARAVNAEGLEVAKGTRPVFLPRNQEEALGTLLRTNIMAASSAVLRRSALDQLGYFDPRYHLTGDWDMWIRVAEAFPVAGVSDALVYYRLHAANLSRARIPLLRETVAVQEAAIARVASSQRWGTAPGLRPYLAPARRRLASRYSELGLLESRIGNRAAALEAVTRAVLLHPWTPRFWTRFLRAWLRR